MVQLSRFATANMEVSIVTTMNNSDQNYTQKEMTAKIMMDIEKIFNKLDELQKDINTRPTRAEIYGWIIAGISIATLVNVLMQENKLATLKIDTKTLAPIILSAMIGAFGWVFNSIEEIKSHQRACDAMVIEMNSELDMLESNFTELLFKLNG